MECKEYPMFHVSKKGSYICGCDEWLDILEDALDHLDGGEVDGYCKNGIKFISTDLYECVCGKQLDRYTMTEKHRRYFKTSCMTEFLRKRNSYCRVCNLQCQSIASYYIHRETQKHKRNLVDNTKLNLYCETCNITCISQAHAREHYETTKHKTLLSKEKLPLECKICNIKVCSQNQIRAHLQTNKHKKLTSIQNVCQSINS